MLLPTRTHTHTHTQFVEYRPAYICKHTNIHMRNSSNGTVSKPESAAAQLIAAFNGNVISHLITKFQTHHATCMDVCLRVLLAEQ